MSRSRSERHQAQERNDLKSLYEDPDAPITIQVHAPNQGQPNIKGSQAKTKRAGPLPITEELIPNLENQNANVPPASTPQYANETVSDDEEPIYGYIADLTADMEEHDTAAQGDQSVKHRIDSFKVNYNIIKPMLSYLFVTIAWLTRGSRNSLSIQKQKTFSDKDGLEELYIKMVL
jgi:hypothetical protein